MVPAGNNVASIRQLLLKAHAPLRVAGLGGLMECQGCGAVGADAMGMRHQNCLLSALT
jgi:hypothetical protein